MEEAKKTSYKYCIVPQCKNSIKKTPDKVFFRIPCDEKIRKQWCKVMRRDNISPKSCLYCCEDHFNVKEDKSNYIQYIIMKQQREKNNLRLKKGVVPHIFLCQKRNLPPPAERMGVIKRQRLTLVNKALSELALKSSNVSKNDEPSQISDHKISTSNTNIYDSNQPGPSTSPIKCEDKFQSDKAVQVNIKPKYRSKGVNVNITTEKQNVALSPLKFPLATHNIETSPVKLSVLKRKCLNDYHRLCNNSSLWIGKYAGCFNKKMNI